MSKKHKDAALPKDAAIFAGWIAGLLLIAGLLWFFTQPVRERFMLNAVNQVLEQSGDTRRLEEALPAGALPAAVSRMGSWYTMTGQPEGTRAFVFMFVAEGTFFPSVAVVAPGGRAVQEFIPLSNHAERMLRRVSPEILRLYSRRITGAEL